MPRIQQLFARNTAWDSQTSGDDVIEYASGSATHLWILSGAATGNYMQLQQTEMPPKWKIRKVNLVGGIPTPLKNMSQLGLLFPIYGKKHVPNHEPEMEVYGRENHQ